MILFRDITYKEYNRIYFGGKPISYKEYDEKCNNFHYQKGKEYTHFFRYIEHAKLYLPSFGEMIIKCDIPDDKIVEKGFGMYTYKKMLCAAIPEYIINIDDYLIDYVKESNPSMRNSIKKINGVSEAKIYEKLLKELYIDWYNIAYPLDYGEYQFYTYIVDYFDDVGLDAALNIYAKKKNRILCKKR